MASAATRQLTVLGGGPAGLGAAYYGHRAGLDVQLFEQAPELGGLCRTFHCGKHAYDSGAHRFHDRDREITADLRALLGERLGAVHSRSKIYDQGQFLDFPPTVLNLLRSSGLSRLARAGSDLIAARLRRRPQRSFEDFAVHHFGESLARRYLLDYSEKVWGLPARDLSPDVATRRLSGMTVKTLLIELIAPDRAGPHIDGDFLYPTGGYGAITSALAAALPATSLHTNRQVVGLACEAGSVRRIELADGSSHEPTGRIISTLPLPRLASLLGNALPERALQAARQLRHRAIRLIFLRLDRPRITSNATLYLPDRRLCLSRVHEPQNRCPTMAPPSETSLVGEVPCFPGDDRSNLPAAALARQVIAELSDLGLIDDEQVIEWRHHLLPAAYPVYQLGYGRLVATALEGLTKLGNLHSLGRGAQFRYSHLHHQLRWAKDCIAALVHTEWP